MNLEVTLQSKDGHKFQCLVQMEEHYSDEQLNEKVQEKIEFYNFEAYNYKIINVKPKG